MDNKLKITIGVPNSNEYLHRHFVQSLMSLQYPTNVAIDFNMIFGNQIPFARNRIVQEALKNNSDYVLFIDADMVFPADMLIRLLKHDLDIVNALAFRRIKPHYPCIFKFNDKEKTYETVQYTTGLQKVDATGMPAILIKTDVFKKMKEINPDKPWYYYRDNMFSSDLTFCENARKAGYKIMIDTDLKIGHIGTEVIVTEEFYLNHLTKDAIAQHNEGLRQAIKNEKADYKLNDPSIKK